MSDLLNSASLVMIPSGYKEDVVYSQIPTDGSGDLSFTRASNGTRVNSAGLVEVVAWNLLEQSETFDNGVWAKESGNSVTANTTTAPNGTTTADTLSATATNTINTYQVYAITAGVYTYSVYVKKKSTNIILTYIYQTGVGFAAIGEINFDNETFTNGTIESVGDGWFRVALSATLTTQTHTFGFYTSSTTGTRDVYIWGAQLNIGSTAKPYFPTTDRLNVPRLTYQNGGGGCPSLLLEKQSTNLQIYSEQINLWSNTSDLSVTANSTTSPDGTQNADKLNENSSNGYHITGDSNITLLASTIYTNSFFAKASERSYARMLAPASNFATESAYFDLTNGVCSASAGTVSTQSMGDGWYRCVWSLTTLSSVSGGIGMWFGPARNMTDAYNTYTGTSGSGIFAYGAQIEASSYPTSYIPTTSSSATRVADACSKTGISSLIGQTEGVLFVDLVPYGIASGAEILPISIFASGAGTGGIQAYFSFLSNGVVRFVYYDGSAVQALISTASGFWSVGNRYKLAAVYKQNDFAFYINGVQIGTDNSGNVSAMADLYLDYQGGIEQYAVNQVALFKTRLTNAELASLTTI